MDKETKKNKDQSCPKCGELIATYYGLYDYIPEMLECKACNIHFHKSELEKNVKVMRAT